MNVNEAKFIGHEQAKGDNERSDNMELHLEARLTEIEERLKELAEKIQQLSDSVNLLLDPM